MDEPEKSEPTPVVADLADRLADPVAQEPAEPTITRKPARGGWLLSAFLAGLATAAAGFGGGVLLVQRYPELLSLTGGAGVDQRLSDHDKRLSDLAAQVAQIADQPGSTAALETLRAEGQAVTKKLAADQAAIAQEVQALSGRLEKVESLPLTASGDTAAQIAAQTARAEENARAAQAAAQKLMDEAGAATRRAALESAIGTLTAALESGAPLDPALGRLSGIGIAVPDALTQQAQGVPTLRALRGAYPDAARDALAQSLSETAESGLWARTLAFLRSQSGARSLTPRAGTDPDAILSRAEAALNADDLSAALKEIGSLPPAGQARMAEWVGLAQRRLDAKTAIAALSATAN